MFVCLGCLYWFVCFLEFVVVAIVGVFVDLRLTFEVVIFGVRFWFGFLLTPTCLWFLFSLCYLYLICLIGLI